MSSGQPPLPQQRLPLLGRIGAGVGVLGIKIASALMSISSRSNARVDIIKTYQCRSHLPIHVFIPPSHDASSATKLPTVFTIHGGGYTVGSPSDDDQWNRTFADTHNVLVIALNYSKGPIYTYPTALHDAEALLAEALRDTNLPIDPSRCAIAGFSAGGNLTLALAQSKQVTAAFEEQGSSGFTAAIPIYPGLDRSVGREVKATQRRYKAALSPNRNSTKDILMNVGNLFEWAYIPVGQNLRDPMVSPMFASRKSLPPHIFMIACELDLSCHDAWRMACRLAGRPIPALDDRAGRDECGEVGVLELEDERFAWYDKEEKVRWLLIPDVVHSFDHLSPSLLGDETTVRDARLKTEQVIHHVGDWLWKEVWG